MRPRRETGFTLIELIIAIFIALIIFMVGFSSISTTMAVRKDSEKRIGAAEDARMLCKTLARDLAGAYPMSFLNLGSGPGVWKPQDTIHQKDNGVAVAPNQSDRLEFYTRIDHRGVADQLVFVRYYVNNFGHLCRQVIDSGTDPTILTAVPPPLPSYLTDDSDAVFDGVNAVFFLPLQWNPDTKTYQNLVPWPWATHIQVDLLMYDQVLLMEDDLGKGDNKGRFGQRRTFIQVLELPYSMTNF